MKKILMTLVLAPVMVIAGESAAVTNTCDASRNPRPVGDFRRSSLPPGPRPTVNGYKWTYYVRNGAATIGSPRKVSRKNSEPVVSPKPTGHVTIPSMLDGYNVTCIGDSVFRNCGELTSVTIPEGLTTIGGCAFENCGKLTSVEIPSSVLNIGGGAFAGCDQLTSVKLPQGLKEIGFFAFKMCRKLTSLTIPKDVARIGGEAFAGCTRIKHIEVDPSNRYFTSIDGVVYTKDRKELVVCPSGLSSVKILDGVTNIRVGAFSGCGGLTALELPNSVTNIGQAAFSGCPFATIALPQGLRGIGGGAFYGCAALSSITIPDSVTFIGDIAFDHCSDLTSVTMRGVCPISSTNAFHKCNKLMTIHVPANSKDWAGKKEWLGVPLVFDGDPLDPLKEKELIKAVQKRQAEVLAQQERVKAQLEAQQELLKAHREAERAEQKKKLQEIQGKLKRVRAEKSKQEKSPQSNSTNDKAK